MFPTMFDRGSLPAMEAWLHFTAARHKAIAHNIANVETPFYRAIDVPEGEFRRLMLRAFDERRRSPAGLFELEKGRGVTPRAGRGVEFAPIERPPGESGILRHIDNNVDIDIEFAQMVKNRGTHNLLANLIAHQFNLIREAVSGKIS